MHVLVDDAGAVWCLELLLPLGLPPLPFWICIVCCITLSLVRGQDAAVTSALSHSLTCDLHIKNQRRYRSRSLQQVLPIFSSPAPVQQGQDASDAKGTQGLHHLCQSKGQMHTQSRWRGEVREVSNMSLLVCELMLLLSSFRLDLAFGLFGAGELESCSCSSSASCSRI